MRGRGAREVMTAVQTRIDTAYPSAFTVTAVGGVSAAVQTRIDTAYLSVFTVTAVGGAGATVQTTPDTAYPSVFTVTAAGGASATVQTTTDKAHPSAFTATAAGGASATARIRVSACRVKYLDPDGREEELTIINYGKTIIDIIDVLQARPENREDMLRLKSNVEEIFNTIGESPLQFAAYSSVAVAAAFIGIDIYQKDDGVYNIFSGIGSDINALKESGIDLMGKNLTFNIGTEGRYNMNFNGSGSDGNVSLTTENKFSFKFNAMASMSVEFGLGVDMPLVPGIPMPDFRNARGNTAGRNIAVIFSMKF